jgi:lipopolysaccharide/colanic/teichoic acid biosynthesis glycosyltransferase
MYPVFFKRFLDAVVSLAALAALSPLILALAALVKLGSPGPVFFRQTRTGKNGRPFQIYKFRSMRVDDGSGKKQFEPGDKSRVTPVGAMLRKTKLDELPQLINVLKGEMSLTGPRPEVPKYTEIYPERWKKVLSVAPGITDPASIVYRHEEEILAAAADPEKEYRENILPRKLDIYEKYVENVSLAGDVKIIFSTILAVVFSAGTHSGEP